LRQPMLFNPLPREPLLRRGKGLFVPPHL
jgi:hypothetical protein